eukprot:15365411-Ditylum_brightwellii.AAC.1
MSICNAFVQVKKIKALRCQWLYASVFVDAMNKVYSPEEKVKLKELMFALNSLPEIREMQNDDNIIGVFIAGER